MFATKVGNGLYNKMWEVLRMLFVLPHGQASVERGFSVNKPVMSTRPLFQDQDQDLENASRQDQDLSSQDKTKIRTSTADG
jgi:hypothetical protein